jgi:RNA polymerase-binding protein DksA
VSKSAKSPTKAPAKAAKQAPAKTSANVSTRAEATKTATKTSTKTASKPATKTASKPATKKSPANKAAAQHATPVKIAQAKNNVATQPAAKAAPAKTVTPTPPALPSPPSAPVIEEDPWTDAELNAIRAELEGEVDRLRGEIETAESELADRLRDGGDGAGDDQADAGTKTFEREQEMSLANNARDLLVQTQHALARIDAGTYGRCENCGNPIGKLRLQANPRATLCVSCKQREERR